MSSYKSLSIDELFEMVDADVGGKLRRDLTDWEASRNQSLHQKYRKILYYENIELERMKAGIAPLIRSKKEYYSGKASEEVYKANPFPLRLESKGNKVIKEDLNTYLDADPEIIAARDFIIQQAEKVAFLRDTLTDISKRSYSISNIINTQRFKAGLDKLNENIDLTDPDNDMND